MKTDKELLESLETSEKLKNRGYEKIRCVHCKGIGQIDSVLDVWRDLGVRWIHCHYCNGKGFKWKSPLMC